jgi:hypothetical protein
MAIADQHPEYKVLEVLLYESPLFHKFHDSERPKIKLPLAWIRESCQLAYELGPQLFPHTTVRKAIAQIMWR